MESMVDAIFDRGFYRRIDVLDSEGTPLIERRVEVSAAGVPGWFIDWLGFRLPTGEAIVMAGAVVGGVALLRSRIGHSGPVVWGEVQPCPGTSSATNSEGSWIGSEHCWPRQT